MRMREIKGNDSEIVRISAARCTELYQPTRIKPSVEAQIFWNDIYSR